MKLILTSVFAMFLTIGFSQLKSVTYTVEPGNHEGHNHAHSNSDDDARATMLKDFDYKAAEAKFVSLGLPSSEHEGWMHFQEDEYIIKNFPDYFVNQIEKGAPKGTGPGSIPSKNAGCPNAGFENLVFAPEWTGGIGSYGVPFANNTIQTAGLNALNSNTLARHTILNIPPGNNNPFTGPVVGYDPLAVNPVTGLHEIPFIAPFGGGASVRLGNAVTGSQKERLQYVFTVTPNNKAFYYQFAVLFNNPAGHLQNEQPYFSIKFLDTLGNLVGGNCGQYNIFSSQAPFDTTYTAMSGGASYYKKWTRVNVDLSPYIGQDITVEFENADCSLGGHWGYAYVDAGCLENLDANVDYCLGDAFAQLVAEPGFTSYQWFGPNNNIPIAGATNDTLLVPAPSLGDTFKVEITTSNGCLIIQNIAIQYSQVDLDDLYNTGTCYGGDFGSSVAQATGSQSGYVYTWTLNGTTVGTNANGTLNNLYAGTYNLNIASNNPNCGQIDTAVVIASPPLIPDLINTNFCQGEGFITAPGTGPFQWYDDNGDPIPAPAGTQNFLIDSTAFQGENVYLLYALPNGCYDSIVYTLQDNIAPSSFTIVQSPGFGCRSRQINFIDATPSSNLINYIINGPNGFNVTTFSTPISQWNYNNLDTGTYDVRVVDNGCFYDTTFTIDDLEDSTSSTTLFCPGTAVNLVASSSGNHSWSDPLGVDLGGGLGINTMAIPAPLEGTYYDSSLVSPGCYYVSAFHLDSITLIAAYTVDQPNCYGGFDGSITGAIVQGIPGSSSYSTTGPNGYSSNFNPATGLAAGVYTVTASVSTCTVTNQVLVGQPPFPPDTLWMYTQTCDELGQSTIYGPEGYDDYQWFFNGNPINGANGDTLAIDLPTQYELIYLTYTSPVDGCQKKTSAYLFEPFSFNWNPDEYNNVFTPNNDELNRFYYPVHTYDKSVELVAYLAGDYSMVIYNRWGNKIFESNNYLIGWDGQFNGTPVQDGTYFAEIMYRTLCDDQINKVVQVIHVMR